MLPHILKGLWADNLFLVFWTRCFMPHNNAELMPTTHYSGQAKAPAADLKRWASYSVRHTL